LTVLGGGGLVQWVAAEGRLQLLQVGEV